MEKIVKTTTYWLFKPITTSPKEKNYFVRSITTNRQEVSWFIGYKNQNGLVSAIGRNINPSIEYKLELEFQKALENERMITVFDEITSPKQMMLDPKLKHQLTKNMILEIENGLKNNTNKGHFVYSIKLSQTYPPEITCDVEKIYKNGGWSKIEFSLGRNLIELYL